MLDVQGNINLGVGSGTPTISFLGAANTNTITKTGTNQLATNARWQVYDGTAAAPGTAFTSDITTGFYLPSAGNLGLVAGGAEGLRIQTNGNVGIGTTAPRYKLSVAGGGIQVVNTDFALSTTGTYIRTALGATSGDTYGYIDVLKTGETAYGNLALAPNGGNVGIGTTGPTEKLHIVGGNIKVANNYNVVFGDTSGNNGAKIGVDGSSNLVINQVNSSSLIFKTANVEQMRILSAGNVGIGTTGPTATLDIGSTMSADNQNVLQLSQNNNLKSGISGLYIPWATGAKGSGSHYMINGVVTDTSISSSVNMYGLKLNMGNGTSTSYGLYVEGEDKNYISGNVGIGTTGPLFKLDVNGTMRVTATSTFSGNVGIGTTAPAYALDVKATGATGIVARFNNDNTSCLFNADGTISCSSDARLKKNVEDLDYGLNEIMALRPVAFNWNTDADGAGKGISFIAQEVETILPKLVMTDPANGYKSLNTIGLVPVLAKAIQDQQKEIEALKLVLGPEGTFSNASSTLATAQEGGLFGWLAQGLNSLGLALQDGVASLKEVAADAIISDLITSKKSVTDQMCVTASGNNEICLTGDQLKDLIEKSGASMTSIKTYPSADGNQSAMTTETPNNAELGDAAATTTEEISQDQGAVILNQSTSETATTSEETVQ